MGEGAVLSRLKNDETYLYTNCNICKTDSFSTLISKYWSNFKAIKVVCNNCGLVYTNPIPSDNILLDYHQNNTPKLLKKDLLINAFKQSQSSIPRFYRIKPYLRNKKSILDVSNNSAEFSYLLRKKGFDIDSLEFNQQLIDHAKKFYHIDLIKKPFNQTKFTKQYDLIISHHNLHLHTNPLHTLQEYYKILNDNGIINIEVPNVQTPSISPKKRFPFDALYNYSLITLQNLLLQSGFKPINIIVIPRSYHINVIAKKSTPNPSLIHADTASILQYNSIYNSLSHYLLLSVYKKFFRQLYEKITISRSINKYNSSVEMVESIFKNV